MRRLRTTTLIALVSLGGAVAFAGVSGASPTDPFIDRQWNLPRVGAPEAWATATGGEVVVAVVDTGVDRAHPDLRDNLVSGVDVVDPDTPPDDENGHGTHVSGIVAAVRGNGVGVAGVAPGARVMPVRVLNAGGSGTLGDVEAGVRYAIAHGADVVNLSLGGDVVIDNLTGGSLATVLNEAWAAGVIPVVSAGNDVLFPSGYRGVSAIVVTATGPDDTKPPYASDVGFAKWGMAAPGGDRTAAGETSTILSTYWSTDGEAYAWAQGTSMAVPHVSAAAAILRGLGLGPQQTVDRLLSTAADIGASGNDFTFGSGRLDVAAAVEGLGGSALSAEAGGSPDPTSQPAATPTLQQSPRPVVGPAEAPVDPTEPPTTTEAPTPVTTSDPPSAEPDPPDDREPGFVTLGAERTDDNGRGVVGPVAVAMVLAAAGAAGWGSVGRRSEHEAG